MINRNPALERASFPVPHSVLEAGGESSTILMAAIERRVEEMAPGQVLEVASLAPTASLDAAMWCYVTGNRLIAMLTEGSAVHCWIRKC